MKVISPSALLGVGRSCVPNICRSDRSLEQFFYFHFSFSQFFFISVSFFFSFFFRSRFFFSQVLYSDRSKVTHVTVGRDIDQPTKVFRVCKITIKTKTSYYETKMCVVCGSVFFRYSRHVEVSYDRCVASICHFKQMLSYLFFSISSSSFFLLSYSFFLMGRFGSDGNTSCGILITVDDVWASRTVGGSLGLPGAASTFFQKPENVFLVVGSRVSQKMSSFV